MFVKGCFVQDTAAFCRFKKTINFRQLSSHDGFIMKYFRYFFGIKLIFHFLSSVIWFQLLIFANTWAFRSQYMQSNMKLFCIKEKACYCRFPLNEQFRFVFGFPIRKNNHVNCSKTCNTKYEWTWFVYFSP